MPKSLPPYETIVRWTVKDVVEWLKEAGLGEFKDHVTKHNIDGNKLASLSEFDVNNFVGKTKKKVELQNYILTIKKPKNVQSRAWNPPPQKQSSSNSKNGYDSGSDDSIYSWGDEFSDDDGGKGGNNDDDDDDENYVDIDNGELVSNTQKDEELYEEPQNSSEMPLVSSLKAALLEFQASRSHSPTRFQQDSTDQAPDSEAGYLRPVYKTEPEAGPQRPPASTPVQRPPKPIPPPTAAPLLPGQKIPTVKSKKSIPKPPVDEYYEDPDKQTQSKPRRAPPPPPPDSPDFVEQEYLNLDQIEADRKRRSSIPKINPPPIPASDDGYIKYNPNNQDVYIDPDEDEAKPTFHNGNRPPLPSIPTAKETKSAGRKTFLPPVPISASSSRKKSQPDTPTRKTSQTDTQTRKTSQTDTPTRKTSQPDTPTVKISQPDQGDRMGIFEWYHNDLERAIAESRLKNYKHDGMFLVRKSLKGGQVHPYTLMVFYNAKVFNFPVRKRDSDGKFALGKKDSPDDVAFDTVDALIQNHQKVNMILQGTKGQGLTAKLTKPLPK